MNIEITKIGKIKPNPDNPRVLKDDKFQKLKKSIDEFPQMMELRPIVVDENMMILGGNMRYRACQDLKLKEVPVVKAENLTEEQKKEFIIKDNVSFGEWDWDMIANDWDAQDLPEWGLEVWQEDNHEVDYSDKNQEIDVDFFSNNIKLSLEYPEEEYQLVKSALLSIEGTPEQAVWTLLKEKGLINEES